MTNWWKARPHADSPTGTIHDHRKNTQLPYSRRINQPDPLQVVQDVIDILAGDLALNVSYIFSGQALFIVLLNVLESL